MLGLQQTDLSGGRLYSLYHGSIHCLCDFGRFGIKLTLSIKINTLEELQSNILSTRDS